MNNHQYIHGLKPEEDSFGNNIYESYNSGNLYSGYEIEERSDGRFILYGDSNAYFEPFEEWTSIQKKIAAEIKGRILDVGCGGGKHSLYFQENDQDVSAMDNSPKAIETCKMRGIRKTIVCDVEYFHLIEDSLKFDHIIFWGNNLGLFQSRDFFLYFMEILEHYTHSDSLIHLESMSPYGEGFSDTETVEYVRQNLLQKRLGGQMNVRVRYKKFVTPWTDYLFLSIEELRELVNHTNWEIVNILEDNETYQYIAQLKKNSKGK
jgi:2-polyprenyl-3-methyl-5-hydroxy-6-metoxy-1,4-benzoquinol methylase